jgi:hypothetical protein
VVEGDPWHGPNVIALLEGCRARRCRAGGAGAHSITELVLHMTGWTREVQARLEGEAAGEPAGGDWPPCATCRSVVDRRGDGPRREPPRPGRALRERRPRLATR